MKRLVCVVEGEGEVAAVPNLCARILQHIGIEGWVMDPNPIRQPRSSLVDEGARSPRRPCLLGGVSSAVARARKRPADAVLLLCDADDDCPAVWGPSAERAASAVCPSAAVMAVREYETWLLWSYPDELRHAAKILDPERKRGAKEELRKLEPRYKPATHQLALTRRIDVAALRARSDSFDKLVRALAALCGATAPIRPACR